jgi:hypothetical protein
VAEARGERARAAEYLDAAGRNSRSTARSSTWIRCWPRRGFSRRSRGYTALHCWSPEPRIGICSRQEPVTLIAAALWRSVGDHTSCRRACGSDSSHGVSPSASKCSPRRQQRAATSWGSSTSGQQGVQNRHRSSCESRPSCSGSDDWRVVHRHADTLAGTSPRPKQVERIRSIASLHGTGPRPQWRKTQLAGCLLAAQPGAAGIGVRRQSEHEFCRPRAGMTEASASAHEVRHSSGPTPG